MEEAKMLMGELAEGDVDVRIREMLGQFADK